MPSYVLPCAMPRRLAREARIGTLGPPAGTPPRRPDMVVVYADQDRLRELHDYVDCSELTGPELMTRAAMQSGLAGLQRRQDAPVTPAMPSRTFVVTPAAPQPGRRASSHTVGSHHS